MMAAECVGYPDKETYERMKDVVAVDARQRRDRGGSKLGEAEGKD
jgi:hypothetical protein